MKFQNEAILGWQVSKVRTFLFWCLAVVWFSEMLFLGIPFLNREWVNLWHVAPPHDPQLAAASLITGMVGAPVKGAFFVMAVWAIRSANTSTRTALFVSMSLVPPFNLAMPFRYQGFILGPVLVASVLSTILWLSFFIFKEPYRQQQPKQGPAQLRSSARDMFHHALFVITSVIITILAFLFLFLPKTALAISFPCIPDPGRSTNSDLPGMIYHSMASGTHLLALSVGSWIATVNFRRNLSLRRAMTITFTLFVALFFIFPFRQMIAIFGIDCVATPVLYMFALLLVGWLFYTFSESVKLKTTFL